MKVAEGEENLHQMVATDSEIKLQDLTPTYISTCSLSEARDFGRVQGSRCMVKGSRFPCQNLADFVS